jgi:hypothetical protein
MNINSLLINGGKVTGNLIVDRLVMRKGSCVTGNITAKSMACDQFVSIIGRANVHPLAPEFVDSDNNIIIEPPEMDVGVLPAAGAPHTEETTNKKKKKKKEKPKKTDALVEEEAGSGASGAEEADNSGQPVSSLTQPSPEAVTTTAEIVTAGDEFNHGDEHEKDKHSDNEDEEGDDHSDTSPGKKKGKKKKKKNEVNITPEELRERLTKHYQKHNPEKLSNIDEIMEKYKGNEGKLLASLEKKYGTNSVEGGEET